MWEAVGSALKVFFEKHLIPTIIAIVGALALFAFLPEDYWMVAKLGRSWFIICTAGLIFLAVKLIVWLFTKLQYRSYRMKQDARFSARSEEEAKEKIEEWLLFVDKLSPEDRELIMRFIMNGNAPITERGCWYRSWDSIHDTNAFVSTENRDGSKTYKLDDRFYGVMKMIYEQRGSICHF